MLIALVQINESHDFESAELRNRALESSRSPKTEHYKAMSHDKEIAFVSLDRWPEFSEMIVYEIFVPPSQRRQGIATAVLNEVEHISICEGFSNVSLIASPLDHDITEDDLFDWYSRRGYKRDLNDQKKLTKLIGFKHWYARDKFCKAINTLAASAEDIRKRLLHAWQGSLCGLNDEQLPDDLQKDFISIREQLHKFNEAWPGQLDDLKQKEKIDSSFKEKYAHLYPDAVEATLGRIHKKTAGKIAIQIYDIYDKLTEKRLRILTRHCIEYRPRPNYFATDKKMTYELTQLSEQEDTLIKDALQKYGDTFQNAHDLVFLTGNFISSVESDAYVFSLFIIQTQKSLTLALLSCLRNHDVQFHMMLRYALESAVLAGYALHNTNFNDFAYEDADGSLYPIDTAKGKAHKWIERHFSTHSNKIKYMKNTINETFSHANILSTPYNYEVNGFMIRKLFFDIPDSLISQQRLWWLANVSFGLLDFIAAVAKEYPIIKFTDDFPSKIIKYGFDNENLKKRLMKNPRFERWTKTK